MEGNTTQIPFDNDEYDNNGNEDLEEDDDIKDDEDSAQDDIEDVENEGNTPQQDDQVNPYIAPTPLIEELSDGSKIYRSSSLMWYVLAEYFCAQDIHVDLITYSLQHYNKEEFKPEPIILSIMNADINVLGPCILIQDSDYSFYKINMIRLKEFINFEGKITSKYLIVQTNPVKREYADKVCNFFFKKDRNNFSTSLNGFESTGITITNCTSFFVHENFTSIFCRMTENYTKPLSIMEYYEDFIKAEVRKRRREEDDDEISIRKSRRGKK